MCFLKYEVCDPESYQRKPFIQNTCGNQNVI